MWQEHGTEIIIAAITFVVGPCFLFFLNRIITRDERLDSTDVSRRAELRADLTGCREQLKERCAELETCRRALEECSRERLQSDHRFYLLEVNYKQVVLELARLRNEPLKLPTGELLPPN